ncbi:NAD(P)H-dependent oxidoreductase [Campylobacter concisus]
MPEAKFDILSELYKNYVIDVKAEQEKLVKADVIVLVYPFFWYGVPSLLQKWLEDVLVHGFFHGNKGDKLRGKKLVLSFTSGAPEELYKKEVLQRLRDRGVFAAT